MKLVIKSFGQHVDLDNTDSVSHFLLVQDESGKSLHLPVPQETIEEITRFIYRDLARNPHPDTAKHEAAEEPEPEPEQEEVAKYATEFGGSDVDDQPEEEPDSEEQVPSI